MVVALELLDYIVGILFPLYPIVFGLVPVAIVYLVIRLRYREGPA